jgi:uncharacterized protein (DUF305 family)
MRAFQRSVCGRLSGAISLAALLACVSLTVQAQQNAAMPGMNMAAPAAGSGASASTQAFQQGEAQMMQNMSAPPYVGDADRDFVAHMIPHHQGAVNMAQVELKYGRDPAIKKLARDIIKAQDQEIAFMQKWQAQHAHP